MTSHQTTRFLLVPDSGAARRIRRLLAQGGARTGVVVGTWLELVEHATDAYALPLRQDRWEERFQNALVGMPDAFWAASLAVAPRETAGEVEAALTGFVAASDPGGSLHELATTALPPRARRHVDDLIALVAALDGTLPGGLAAIRDLLAANADDAIRRLAVSRVPDAPALSRWQIALVDKLNRDAGRLEDGEPAAVLQQTLADHSEPAGAPAGLARLQARVFSSPGDRVPIDDSLQWIGVRDYLAEVETAAGMVQTMLDTDPSLGMADIGLLLPDEFIYAVAVDDVFKRVGLPVSGLPLEHWRRELGREALFHFLYCRQKPAPAMALAVCLSSPLMPWSREDGAVLAQTVMEGDYRLRALRSMDARARAMLDLIREGDEAPGSLAGVLRAFVDLLDDGVDSPGHVQQARGTVDELCQALAYREGIDWAALRVMASPGLITAGDGPDFNLAGITVWREGLEPWRAVRHLIVCGFATGHYPLGSGQSPVFSTTDLDAVREHLGLMVDTPADALARRRARFRRQLAAATESVSFLVPRRDPPGAAQAPSESLVFMHGLFAAPDAEEPEALVLDLDAAEDREKVRFLARAPDAEPRNPRAIAAADIHFGRDLLAMRTDRDGNPKPESPSSLETLMVSRLAWLLRRLEAEPLEWAPESLDPMLMGTLAHQVFETLFPSGGPLPGEEEIRRRTGPLLEDAIGRSAPFLRAAQWQVERRHLATETTRAALAWRDVLTRLDAEVIASEIWLAGRFNDIPIHGQADALLGLPGNRLLVVDYKRSSSGSRRPRMDKGFDSQASLYRTMLRTGGPKDTADAPLLERLRRAEQVGVVYYMLNDRVALSDTTLWEVGTIPGWEAMDDDIAGNAVALIEQRLNEVRKGLLTLNREDDARFFDKDAGIKPYALGNSPLITLFTRPDGSLPEINGVRLD
ncbi:MAG: PD-(D/E)XK nuclease family protein [Gammaproteobacteria bacterium]|nr:PD-(D/E)XK nuclease family protein [Gammaproteobacteria bacterium]